MVSPILPTNYQIWVAPVSDSGMDFRNSNFLKISVQSSPTGDDKVVCVDTGCGMSCVDRKFLNTQFKGAVIQTIQPLKSRGLGEKVHQSDEYAVVTIYLSVYKEKAVLAAITLEVHVVDFLPCNRLIGIDVADPDPEGFLIDILRRKITIRSYKDIVCSLRITPRAKLVENRMVRTKRERFSKSIPKDNSGPIQEARRRPRLSFSDALQSVYFASRSACSTPGSCLGYELYVRCVL